MITPTPTPMFVHLSPAETEAHYPGLKAAGDYRAGLQTKIKSLKPSWGNSTGLPLTNVEMEGELASLQGRATPNPSRFTSRRTEPDARRADLSARKARVADIKAKHGIGNRSQAAAKPAPNFAAMPMADLYAHCDSLDGYKQRAFYLEHVRHRGNERY